MTTKQRYDGVIKWFLENVPSPKTELHYENPYQLLIAVILSAQCTDKRVNIVTPPLFEAFPTPYDMAKSLPEDVFPYIKSVTFPNNKSKSLVGMATVLVEKFNGEVPSSLDELVKIPGVGRKTANVILAVVYNRAAMAVDTHVFRVSNRIGLTENSPNPLITERTLVKYIPEELISTAHHWLILHGRYVCMARKPNCLECGIRDFCEYYKNAGKSNP
ncbi:MAG: endonuclease III [Muribaculaceae bacterium]